jgi:hypothetical protein
MYAHLQPIAANAWSKICVTADDGEYVVYLNGQAIGTYVIQGNRNVISHSAATLGFVDDDFYDLFNGYIDDVSITVLRASQIEIHLVSASVRVRVCVCVSEK